MSLKKSVSKQDQELVLIKETKAIARLPIQRKYAGGADIPIRLIKFYADKNDLWQGLKATNPNMGRVVARQRLMQLTDEQLAAVEAESLAAYEVESAASRAGADPDRVLTISKKSVHADAPSSD